MRRDRQLQTVQTLSSETSFRVHPLEGLNARGKSHKDKRLHEEIVSTSKINYFHEMIKVDMCLLSDIIQYLCAPQHRCNRCSSVQRQFLSLLRPTLRFNSSDPPFQTFAMCSTSGSRRCAIERSLQSGRISVQSSPMDVQGLACS